MFADELRRLADETSDPRLTAVADSLVAPLPVAVRGRRGVGRRTVAAALRRAGATIVEQGADAFVYVLAEVLKPEDGAAVAALTGAARPVLVVLNKADVAGGASAAAISARLGVPVHPVSGLLALSDHPAGGIDAVAARLAGLHAVVHHRRVTEAMTRLAALAVGAGRIGDLLMRDETVAARWDAAEAAMAALGPWFAAAAPAGGPDADLQRARRWQRYRSAPVAPLPRACAADITRGALRRWLRTQEPA